MTMALIYRKTVKHCRHFPFTLMSPCVGRPHQHAAERETARAAQHPFIVAADVPMWPMH